MVIIRILNQHQVHSQSIPPRGHATTMGWGNEPLPFSLAILADLDAQSLVFCLVWATDWSNASQGCLVLFHITIFNHRWICTWWRVKKEISSNCPYFPFCLRSGLHNNTAQTLDSLHYISFVIKIMEVPIPIIVFSAHWQPIWPVVFLNE